MSINSMLYRTAKNCLIIGLFVAIATFNCASAKGLTNELNSTDTSTNKLVWYAEKPTYQGKIDTNGLTVRLAIDNNNINECSISISNQSSNKFYGWCYPNHYPATWLKVELLDSNGQLVERTEAGKEYGKPINMAVLHETIRKRFREWVSGRARTTGFWPIVPSEGWYPLTDFNLSELFKLKQAGKYTLNIQVPMIQRVGHDEANPQLKTVWIPEITVKIQIRADDAPK